MTKCKFWVQKLLDHQKEKLGDKQKVPNQGNQIQTQVKLVVCRDENNKHPMFNKVDIDFRMLGLPHCVA